MAEPPTSKSKPQTNAHRNRALWAILQRDTTTSQIVPQTRGSLYSGELRAPLVPLLFQNRKDELQIAADVLAAVHLMRKRDRPDTPAVWFKGTDLRSRDLVSDLPY